MGTTPSCTFYSHGHYSGAFKNNIFAIHVYAMGINATVDFHLCYMFRENPAQHTQCKRLCAFMCAFTGRDTTVGQRGSKKKK